MLPLEKDVVDGPAPIEILARVAAQLGEPDRAIAALQKLLSIPSEGALASRVPLTPALLRLDPMFDPLRNDQRFPEIDTRTCRVSLSNVRCSMTPHKLSSFAAAVLCFTFVAQCMHNNLRQNGWLKFRLRCAPPNWTAGSFTISGTAIPSPTGF